MHWQAMINQPEASSVETAPKRKSCAGCLFTGTLGCAAFLFGALFSVMLFAPSFLGDPVAYYLEDWLNSRIAGRVHITELELAWDGRQKASDVILHDVDGTEIAWMTISFPSILSLTDISETRTNEVRVSIEITKADLIVDVDGVTNLERALTNVDGALVSGTVHVEADGAELDPGPLVIDVNCETATWSHAARPQLTLSDIEFAYEREGSGLTIDGSMAVTGGSLEFQWKLDDSFAPNWGEVDGMFKASRLPTEFVDSLFDMDGVLIEAFGATLDPTLTIKGDLKTGAAVHGVFASSLANGTLSASYAGGVLTPVDSGLELRLHVPKTLFEARQGPYMPEDVRMVRRSDAESWLLLSNHFTLPVGIGTAAGYDASVLLAGVRGALSVGPTGRFKIDNAQHTVGDFDPQNMTIAVDEEGKLSAELSARLHGTGDQTGSLTMSLSAPFGLAAMLAEEEWPAPVGIHIESTDIPTQVVDDLTSRAGLLVDALGASAALTIDTAWPLEGSSCIATLSSNNSQIMLTGDWKDGFLVAEGEGGLDAQLSLTPVFCERVVGSLAPWMRVQSGSGNGPVTLTLRDVTAPLDGDLSKLSATVHLELGEVEYSLAEEILGVIKISGASMLLDSTSRKMLVPPFDVQIKNGIATYDGLSIDPQQRMQDVKGSLNLMSGQVSIEAKMPLTILGELAGLEAGSGAQVPILLTGDWTSPKVSVEAGAVQNILKDGIEAILDSFLGGTPKPKD